MEKLSTYWYWVRRRWFIVVATVSTMGFALIIIASRDEASAGAVLEALSLAIATSLMVEIVFELSAKEELVNLINESLGIQRNVTKLGIQEVYSSGERAFDEIRAMIRCADQIDLLALSGGNSYPNLEEDFQRALKRGCRIRILLCKEESDFVQDREIQEGKTRKGEISREITRSLRSIFHKICISLNDQKAKGYLEVRTHSRAIYSNMVIQRKSDGQVEKILHVPYLTPTPARFAMAFVYQSTEDSQDSVRKLAECFDTLWTRSTLRLKHDFQTGQHECTIGIEDCEAKQ